MPTDIDAVVAAVEKDDRVTVSNLLNAENAYDRVGIAKLVQERVKQDKTTNPSLPSIEFSTATDFTKKELLLDLQANKSDATSKSLYTAKFFQDEYSRDYSFSKYRENVYQTLDPNNGKVLTEDLSLEYRGDSAHTDVSHDLANQTTIKHRVWGSGTEETETWDKSNHLLVDDVSWTGSSGDLVTRHEVDTYDQATGKRTAKDLTMKDLVTHWDFDAAGHILSEVSKDNSGKVTSTYEAKFDSKTGKQTYENQWRKDFSDLHTFDAETGQVLMEKESWSGGNTITQHYDYDKITHKQIWYERTDADGRNSTLTSNSDGRPLVRDEQLKDGKTLHEDYSYDALGRLLVRNQKDFRGTVEREENKFDVGDGKLLLHTEDAHNSDGTSSHGEDKYDLATGRLVTESFDNVDGTHERYKYQYDTQPAPDQPKMLHISESLISKENNVRDFNYEYTYDYPKTFGKPKHHDILKVLWKGSGANESFTEDEISRIDRIGIWHVSKALPGHGG